MSGASPFTDAELAELRSDIASGRVPGAYEPGRWSVGPGNRDPAVSGVFPERVSLRDTTVRSIEAMPGVVLPAETRLDLLRALAEAGVAEIVTAGVSGREAGAAAADVAAIKAANPDCVAVCPFVGSARAAESARRAGYDLIQVAAAGFGPAALIYDGSIYPAAWRGADWRSTSPIPTRAEVLRDAAALIEHGRGLGLRVAAALTMVSYLTAEKLTEAAAALAAAGASEITLFDGPGALGPEAFAALVREVTAAAPGVVVGIHPHNTFGLAVACSVATARAGAGVIESSVNGYCGGPGNADIATTALAFQALYGVRTGLKLDRLTELARRAEAITGRPTARNQPITGREAFCWGGGDWVAVENAVDPLLHNCVEPELVGNQRCVPLTPGSGPYVMAATLRRLGIEADAETTSAILSACAVEIRGLRRLLDDQEIREIARVVRDRR
jgi:isopropylmalate/homocitrate/citramalate synthase